MQLSCGVNGTLLTMGNERRIVLIAVVEEGLRRQASRRVKYSDLQDIELCSSSHSGLRDLDPHPKYMWAHVPYNPSIKIYLAYDLK